MSFAQNLVYIRQHYAVTQEAMAEQLGVSRQTVSKWEAGINYPETDKLLLLCDLYHTNLDDLMRGNVKIANIKDTELYDAHMNRFSQGIVSGVVLIFLGVATLLFLQGIGFAENLTAAIMLCFIVVGVLLMVVAGLTHNEFKRKNPNIDPSYPDEALDRFGRRFIFLMAVGIGVIMLDVIMIVAFSPENGEIVELLGVSFPYLFVVAVFMLFVALGSGIIIFAGIQKSKYDKSEFSHVVVDGSVAQGKAGFASQNAFLGGLRRERVTGALCGVIMLLATIVFFVLGFSFGGFPFEGTWEESGFTYSWIAFLVGGVLCAVVAIVVNTFGKSKDELIIEARKENPWIKVDKGDNSFEG